MNVEVTRGGSRRDQPSFLRLLLCSLPSEARLALSWSPVIDQGVTNSTVSTFCTPLCVPRYEETGQRLIWSAEIPYMVTPEPPFPLYLESKKCNLEYWRAKRAGFGSKVNAGDSWFRSLDNTEHSRVLSHRRLDCAFS